MAKPINCLPSTGSIFFTLVTVCVVFVYHCLTYHQFAAIRANGPEYALTPNGRLDDRNVRHVRNRPSSKDFGSLEKNANRTMAFVPTQELEHLDIFAASWWQSLPRFLQMNASQIHSVEADAFVPILHTAGGIDDARMAVDWLDFCTEHLSKWWKQIDRSGRSFAVGKLQAYVQRAMSSPADSNFMSSTIAVIPYGVTAEDKLDQNIWRTALEATIAALVRHGIARVVVVGYYDTDTQLTLKAFQNLLRFQEKDASISVLGGTSFSATVGDTELGYVMTKDVKSRFVEVNVPKGALQGLGDAFRDMSKSPARKEWLGSSPERFKYVLLTEADQIIHARLSQQSLDVMDQGGILVPHRLQPIPHPLDLNGIVQDASRVLPAKDFNRVHELGSTDSCCDTNEKPGMKDFGDCGNFWYFCGFNRDSVGNHSRLSSYSFMRLTGGTGIVSLASTEHSRKCIPSKNGCPAKSSSAKN